MRRVLFYIVNTVITGDRFHAALRPGGRRAQSDSRMRCERALRSPPRASTAGNPLGRSPRGLARGFGFIYAVGAMPARFLVAERIRGAPCARRRAA